MAGTVIGRKKLAFIAALTGTFAVATFVFVRAGQFLSDPARVPVSADLLIVLGGGVGDRTLAAIGIYQRGYTTWALVTGLESSPQNATPHYLNWRTRMLEDGGIPRHRILFDTISTNSWEEAVNTRRLMEQRGWHRVLVVSDPPHMRRLSWTWGKAFAGSKLEYTVVASSPTWWKPDIWWRDEKSAQAVITEYVKLGYYIVTR